MVNLRKPLANGTKLILANSEGECSEWIVIGQERKAGRYTGYLRVEYQGWLSASVLEEHAIAEQASSSVEAELTEWERDMDLDQYAADWIADVTNVSVSEVMSKGHEWIMRFVNREYDGGWSAMVASWENYSESEPVTHECSTVSTHSTAITYIMGRELDGVAMPIGWINMSPEMIKLLAVRLGWEQV